MPRKLIINEHLKSLERLCITALLQNNLLVFEEKYEEYSEYSEFIFSVLDYGAGNYATEIGLDGVVTSFFEQVFYQHSNIVSKMSLQNNFSTREIENVFGFHSRLVKFAKSNKDVSSAVDWQLSLYFGFYKQKNREMLKALLEEHEGLIGGLRYYLGGKNRTQYLVEAHVASIKRLAQQYLFSTRNRNYQDADLFRDVILYWPQKILWSYNNGASIYDLYSVEDCSFVITNPSDEEENIYFALYNYQKDIALLIFVHQINHALENSPAIEFFQEFQRLYSGVSSSELSEREPEPVFGSSSELLISYFRILFLYAHGEQDANKMPREIYSRFLDHRKPLMSGRVHVYSMEPFVNASIKPISIFLLSYDGLNTTLLRGVLARCSLNEKESVQHQIQELISELDATLSDNLRLVANSIFGAEWESQLSNRKLTIIEQLQELRNGLRQDIDSEILRAPLDCDEHFSKYKRQIVNGAGGVVANNAVFADFQSADKQREERSYASLEIEKWPRRYLLPVGHELYQPVDSEHFFKSVGERLIVLALRQSLINPIFENKVAKRLDIQRGAKQEYWSKLSEILTEYPSEEFILFLDNRTRPTYLYDWTNKFRRGRGQKRPDDFIFTDVREYKDKSGYVGTINNRMHVIYVPGLIDAGSSLVIQKSCLKRFNLFLEKNSDGALIEIVSKDCNGDQSRIILKVSCPYDAAVDLSRPAWEIYHGEKGD